ncbi:MAG: hypothetical protein OER56_14855, partial [Hyphomicrobiales bacterium]|nr:hypothetical protein [Hyphomicrobiales bacterium]
MKRLLKSTIGMLLAGGFALSASTAFAAECAPSKWGKDDQIGAANYVKPDQVMMAAKLIKKGET